MIGLCTFCVADAQTTPPDRRERSSYMQKQLLLTDENDQVHANVYIFRGFPEPIIENPIGKHAVISLMYNGNQ